MEYDSDVEFRIQLRDSFLAFGRKTVIISNAIQSASFTWTDFSSQYMHAVTVFIKVFIALVSLIKVSFGIIRATRNYSHLMTASNKLFADFRNVERLGPIILTNGENSHCAASPS